MKRRKPAFLKPARTISRHTTANTKAAKKLPLSGSEPLYSELEYGVPRGKNNNNCYAYAIGSYRLGGNYKLQPGNLSDQSSNQNASSCRFLNDRALDDNRKRGIYKLRDSGARCRRGFYKIMSFIDRGKDYHWYVQNGSLLYRVLPGETRAAIAAKFGVPVRNVVFPARTVEPGDMVYVRGAGVFSHKQGLATGPLLTDASRRVITDPRRANRNYGDLNYRRACGAMCIRDIPSAMSSTPSPREARELERLLRTRINKLSTGIGRTKP